jgi:protocatechuate 3,4-dioxygenase beta subunit
MTQEHQHDHGLAADLPALLDMQADRRRSLRWLLAGAAALPALGCGGGSGGSTVTSTTSTATPAAAATGSTGATTTTTTGTTVAASSCSMIPEETGGPYPADGTNTVNGSVVNALALAGVVRQDIRGSFAGATGVAAGVPLTIRLQLVDVGKNCAPLAGGAVYLWHCDRDGNYSLYSAGVTKENYLRGVQEADASGIVTFTTIFPGCYAGRMPHVHFEVYGSLAKAASASNRIRTSQFSFPSSVMTEAYTASGYSASVRNLAGITFATDNVFSDGVSLQIATVTGSAATGYVATLTVGVAG